MCMIILMKDEHGVDLLLQLVAPYRKQDPDGTEEKEYVENLTNTLTASLVRLLHSFSDAFSHECRR